MKEEVYEKLRQHLHHLPLGAPKTQEGVEIKILKKLFTEEEAEVATKLVPNLETVEEIAQRTEMERGKLSVTLEKMSQKGLIFRVGEKGERKFCLVPFVPGVYEFQLGRIDKEFAELFEDYYALSLGQELFGAKTPWMRVISVEKQIPYQLEVFPYERVSHFIQTSPTIALADCLCRKSMKLLGKGCDAPIDSICMLFTPWAEFYIENGLGKKANKEEAFAALDRAEEAGLVHCSVNVRSGNFAICNCCGCCCAILRGVTQLKNPRALVKSNFTLDIDIDSCNGCETCIERCHMGAIQVKNEVAVLDLERCIGCGVCISICPTEALSLRRRDEREIVPPPKDIPELLFQIAKEKGRI